MAFSRYLFHDGGPYHIETSPLICIANEWTGFYMIGTTIMKELTNFTKTFHLRCLTEIVWQNEGDKSCSSRCTWHFVI